MGTLRERQRGRNEAALADRRRIAREVTRSAEVLSVRSKVDYRDSIKARWHGGPTVLAFLFAPPDADAMRMLDQRGDYFDRRTGDTWDLFFPGYYKSTKGRGFESQAGARPAGDLYADNWYFSPHDFDDLRKHVEACSEHRWEYSGATDLVLINGWLSESGDPTIDWVSTISGQLTEQGAEARTLTLPHVIELISRDFEKASEDPSYGVGAVTEVPSPPGGQFERDLVVNALGGIAGALGHKVLGL